MDDDGQEEHGQGHRHSWVVAVAIYGLSLAIILLALSGRLVS